MPNDSNFQARFANAAVALCLALLIGCASGCATPPNAETPVAGQDPDSAEMLAIVDADQADREAAIAEIDWAAVAPRDAARRARVLELIEAGEIQTGNDFARAALVFQHGDGSNDILLAHILAVTALGKGNPNGRRMAAITLDRYLQRIEQPQVFGTQFQSPDFDDPTQWHMEPYDRELIGDRLRDLNCVESLAVQDELLASIRGGAELAPPDPRPCSEGIETQE